MKEARRFGAREVGNGPFAGGLHVPTQQYQRFSQELNYFCAYLNHRLLPSEPEEVQMQGILINLQNLLEHECEALINHYVAEKGTQREQEFRMRIADGYVTFKSKCDWLLARSLITQEDRDVMDEVRRLRNALAHSRPTKARRRFKYRGFPLLAQRSVRRIFVEVELTLRALRAKSGGQCDWTTVPPGYASEMRWPERYVRALER